MHFMYLIFNTYWCCAFTLRTGCEIIGWLTIAVSVADIIFVFFLYIDDTKYWWIVIYVLHIIMSALMLVDVYRRLYMCVIFFVGFLIICTIFNAVSIHLLETVNYKEFQQLVRLHSRTSPKGLEYFKSHQITYLKLRNVLNFYFMIVLISYMVQVHREKAEEAEERSEDSLY